MPLPDEVERWNTRFSAPGFLFGTEPNAFLASQAALLRPGMTALSVADGEGRNSVWLARQGLAVTAFDLSPVAVEKARGFARDAGVAVDFHVGNVLDWDWDVRKYDLVVAIFIQFATPAERPAVFAGLQRALAPGGHLILQGYTPRQLEYRTGGPPHVEHLYTEALLRDHFAGLEIVRLVEHDSVIHEGKGHDGMSALIDLVARKPR